MVYGVKSARGTIARRERALGWAGHGALQSRSAQLTGRAAVPDAGEPIRSGEFTPHEIEMINVKTQVSTRIWGRRTAPLPTFACS